MEMVIIGVVVLLIVLVAIVRSIYVALFPPSFEVELKKLTSRMDRLEKRMALLVERVTKPAAEPANESVAAPVQEKMQEPAAVQETVSEPASIVDKVPLAAPSAPAPASAEPTLPAAQKPLDSHALEKYVGQRVIGWAAVGLAIFAIGFFIKYAYDQGWIVPAGRVAIGELIGLGLITAGWRLHRQGKALGSQMLMGCGIAGCYLATYGAFGFYNLIAQPTAGLFMTLVMLVAGVLAVVTDAFSLGLLTVLGGLLTPLMLNTGQDQHVSLFMYLALLVLSIHVVYLWKPWLALRGVVWLGALAHFGLWYQGYYHTDARQACLVFLGILWLIPGVQILWRGRRVATHEEDWLLFLLTPFILFAIVCGLLMPEYAAMRGKLALLLMGGYGAISYCTWRYRQHDVHQFQLPLVVALVFLGVAIPLELHVGWIGIGWLTQGVVLWGAGLWRKERLVWVFGLMALALGTARLAQHDIWLHAAVGWIPFLHAQAIPEIWLVAGWTMVSGLTFRFRDRLKDGRRIAVFFSVVTFWMLWVVLNVEVYPYCKTWAITTRWMAVPWMLLAIPFYWYGCRWFFLAWRNSAVVLVMLAALRSVMGDLPLLRHDVFLPLLNQLSMPVLVTSGLMLMMRPIVHKYESVLHEDEKQFNPISGLLALAMILLILSLDTYQFCRVQFPGYTLLPHAVLSVVWSLYGALLLSIGFWKQLATLRWSAIGIFGLTLGKVLLIDLGWLAGLYRILALLLIALVLAGVTWTYQRRG
ncbi:MAG: DUF2339 domain-containing protein [Gemmatales bacterium]